MKEDEVSGNVIALTLSGKCLQFKSYVKFSLNQLDGCLLMSSLKVYLPSSFNGAKELGRSIDHASKRVETRFFSPRLFGAQFHSKQSGVSS